MLVYLSKLHQHGKVDVVGQEMCDWAAGHSGKFPYIMQGI